MAKIGIFGGSFNPIHLGHVIPVYEIMKIKKLDRVIYVPNYFSPHKTEIKNIESIIRWEMVVKTVSKIKNFEADDYEIKKKRAVYTYETIEYFKKKFSSSALYLIIGYDQYKNFLLWEKYQYILENVNLLVMMRNNEKMIKTDIEAELISTSMINISSSMVRNWIRNDYPYHLLLNHEVSEFIKTHKLYLEE